MVLVGTTFGQTNMSTKKLKTKRLQQDLILSLQDILSYNFEATYMMLRA